MVFTQTGESVCVFFEGNSKIIRIRNYKEEEIKNTISIEGIIHSAMAFSKLM
jgi:hypothetical protein